MFEINVGILLESYSGDSQVLEFSGDVIPGTFGDVEALSPLSFELTLITLDDGIEAVIRNLDVVVRYETVEHHVLIEEVARTFKTEFDPLATDDVRFVNKKGMSVDLTPVLREEIIMACC